MTTTSLAFTQLAGLGSSARICHQGGQVLDWGFEQSDTNIQQHPVLWTSAMSLWQPGKAVRGGIPICWPWFGPPAASGFPADAPAHGFTRTATWTPVGVTTLATGGQRSEFLLRDWPGSRQWLKQDFELRLIVTCGRSLDVALRVRNASSQPLRWTGALHTYLALSDIRQVDISGCEGLTYQDNMDGGQHKTQRGPITFHNETERIYYGEHCTTRLRDPNWHRTITLQHRGSGSTVIWNPWIDKAQRMADCGDDEWQEMCCIETARAADDALELAAGASHELGVTLSVS